MLSKNKNKIIVFSLVVAGILLIFGGNLIKKQESGEEKFDVQQYTASLENKIENFLINVKGINEVKVIVYLDNSSEKVYSQGNRSGSGASTEVLPTVRGVAIACTNGDSDDVRAEINGLVSSYLGISSARIKIVAIR